MNPTTETTRQVIGVAIILGTCVIGFGISAFYILMEKNEKPNSEPVRSRNRVSEPTD